MYLTPSVRGLLRHEMRRIILRGLSKRFSPKITFIEKPCFGSTKTNSFTENCLFQTFLKKAKIREGRFSWMYRLMCNMKKPAFECFYRE